MQLITLISATLVACSGFAATAPNAIPNTDITWPTAVPAVEAVEAVEGLSTTNSNQTDGLAKRGDWLRKVKMCEHANGGGSCHYKDFRPNTGCFNMRQGLNDRMSSIYLAPDTHCTIFAEAGCRDKWLRVFSPGYSNLKTQSSYMNDKASSLMCAAR